MSTQENRRAKEMPPHWISSDLERIVATGNANRIANHLGRLIGRDPRVEVAIRKALDDEHDGCGPNAAHRVRIAVGKLLLGNDD